MKKALFLAMLFAACLLAEGETTFHDFDAVTIDGDTISMSTFAGKKLLVVNVASKCGYTYQYEGLQKLHKKYENFEVIGFPANNFMNQEPAPNLEIKKFCTSEFGVTFPMMAKISVKGEDIHPIYQWLTDPNGDGEAEYEIMWNFQKFLIDEEGKIAAVYGTKTEPMDDKIVGWIEGE